jgi:TRAP-type C4-dicarboxylate transport system permease small subunit
MNHEWIILVLILIIGTLLISVGIWFLLDSETKSHRYKTGIAMVSVGSLLLVVVSGITFFQIYDLIQDRKRVQVEPISEETLDL